MVRLTDKIKKIQYFSHEKALVFFESASDIRLNIEPWFCDSLELKAGDTITVVGTVKSCEPLFSKEILVAQHYSMELFEMDNSLYELHAEVIEVGNKEEKT